MAWMNQEKKQKIAAELKKVIPSGWKYSLAVRNHSTIVLTIASAPVDLIAECKRCGVNVGEDKSLDVNHYHLEKWFDESLPIFEAIRTALNTDNFDNSDIMTDYFHVGHYIDINIGKWNKPFEVTQPKPKKGSKPSPTPEEVKPTRYKKQNRFTGEIVIWEELRRGARSTEATHKFMLGVPMTQTEADEFKDMIERKVDFTLGAGGQFAYTIENPNF